MDQKIITVVSGLPRSGTSLMMKMLESGGLEILTDNTRQADEDNPKGYYEFERVKQIKHDRTWLEDARGKAVKMVSVFLKHLPGDYSYKVIFMRRKMDEILGSQRQMLVRRGKPTDRASDQQMAASFRRHLSEVEAWLAEQPNVDAMHVSYNEILDNPAQYVRRVNHFLGNTLDEEEMVGVIDQNLYRQRR